MLVIDFEILKLLEWIIKSMHGNKLFWAWSVNCYALIDNCSCIRESRVHGFGDFDVWDVKR